AHVAAGGSWTTELTLVNLSAAPVSLSVALRADDGAAMSQFAVVTNQGISRAVLASSVSQGLAPNASLRMSVGDPTGPNQVGWAGVVSSAPLGGYAVFRAESGSGPPNEASVPLVKQLAPAITFPYDNTAGYVTSVGLANPGAAAATVTAIAWDGSGNRLG